MAQKIINLKFGDGVNANTITDSQIEILRKVATDPNTEAHISGIVTKDYMLESEKYLLEKLGLTVVTTTILDTYAILPEMTIVNEGKLTIIQALNIDKEALIFSIAEIQIAGTDLTETDIKNIKKRITITSTGIIGCAAAQENLTWTAIVTIKSTPAFSEENVKTCLVTFLGIAFTSVNILGPEMLTEGANTTFIASVLPINSTKKVSAVSWDCENGSINLLTGSYIAPTGIPLDVITGTVTVYGRTYNTTYTLLIDTPVLNSTTLNPAMFGIIKTALGLSVDLLTVSDCALFTNALATSLFLYMLLNKGSICSAAAPLQFNEFQYFTGVTDIYRTSDPGGTYGNNDNYFLWMSLIKFPPTLTRLYIRRLNFTGTEDIDFSVCKNITIGNDLRVYNNYGHSFHLFVNPGRLNLKTVIDGYFSTWTDKNIEVILPENFINTNRERIWIKTATTGTLDLSKCTLATSGSIFITGAYNTVNFSSSKSAFPCLYYCSSLKYFTWDNNEATLTKELPSWLTAITWGLFYGCRGLEITSLGNIKSIDSNGFRECSLLGKLDFTKVTSLGDCAFYNCTNLTCDSFGGITSIGNSCFLNCASLNNISLNNITHVYDSAFAYCSNLAITNFGKLRYVKSNSFNGCVKCTFTCSSMSTDFKIYAQTTASEKHLTFVNCISAFSDKVWILGDPISTYDYHYISNVAPNTAVKKMILLGNALVTKLYTACNGTLSLKILDLRLLTNIKTWNYNNWGNSYIRDLLFLNLTNIPLVIAINTTLSNFFGTSTPIYVPDNLVASYKAASNWNNLPSLIFGLSLFKLDAVENGWGTVDDDNNWIVEPEDNEELLATL